MDRAIGTNCRARSRGAADRAISPQDLRSPWFSPRRGTDGSAWERTLYVFSRAPGRQMLPLSSYAASASHRIAFRAITAAAVPPSDPVSTPVVPASTPR
jgi:hypothetical protein